jgi:hypothetical protein
LPISRFIAFLARNYHYQLRVDALAFARRLRLDNAKRIPLDTGVSVALRIGSPNALPSVTLQLVKTSLETARSPETVMIEVRLPPFIGQCPALERLFDRSESRVAALVEEVSAEMGAQLE